MAILEQWSLVQGGVNPYQPPETFTQHLHGAVYGREGFVDGDHVTTSRVVKMILQGDKTFVQTLNTIYELGEVDPEYEKAYPGALARLRKSVVKEEQPTRHTDEIWLLMKYLREQLIAAEGTLNDLILRVPSGETRNALTEINISNMMAQEVLKNLIVKGAKS